jgi:hypothetical protein
VAAGAGSGSAVTIAVLLAATLLATGPSTVDAQVIFHSPQSANLPTAETLQKGQWLFEISHRFSPPVSDGADALWGFDGPVINRLGLAYAASDRVMLGVLRSNLSDNLELNAKARVFEGGSDAVPVMIGLMGGIAWNTEAPTGAGADENESQQYAQLMLNTLLGERLAVGIVPTLLRNPTIEDADSETVFVLGLHGQLYLSDKMSFLAEWIISDDRSGPQHPDPNAQAHDSGSFGIEIETRGHFFKVVLSNQQRLNPTQVLGGTAYEFTPGEWRVGFNIQRKLIF